VLKGLLSYPLSGYQISGLLNHFLQLRAQHVHLTSCVARQTGGTIGVNKIATERNVEPVALFAFDGEFACARSFNGH
jgi:hypothetical protein